MKQSVCYTHFLSNKVFRGDLIFNFEFVCRKSLAVFGNVADQCVFENGAWCFTLRIRKAGERQ